MYVGLIFLAAVVIVSETLAEETKLNYVTSGKRAPMGFQGMRGKKDSLSVFENDEFSKRAPMGFQGMRGKKDPMGPNTLDDILQEDFEKRAPMGFQGMRGKKDFLTLPEIEEELYHEEYDKRGPMGFQGMRGKKTINDDYLKRAMMEFPGTGGKKLFNQFSEELDKRMSMGFQGMRGKKYYQDDYQVDYEDQPMPMELDGLRGKRYEYDSEFKRAPMGFQGMRGKRSSQGDLNSLKLNQKEEFPEELESGDQEPRSLKRQVRSLSLKSQRAPPFFISSRGKRSIAMDSDDADYQTENQGVVGQKGRMRFSNQDRNSDVPNFFVGMKGKRSILDIQSDDGYHRNLPMDLHGSNYINDAIQFEKRSPRGFLGMRGRRIPRWEMKGKFIGVRGKRFSSENNENLMSDLFDNIERIQLGTGSTTNFDNQ